MKIGVFSTFMSPQATPQMIREFGRRPRTWVLSRSGWASTWRCSTRTPTAIGSKDLDASPFPKAAACWIIARPRFSGRRDAKVRLGTGVALVPQRNPILHRQGNVLDWLSDGRIDFGIGVIERRKSRPAAIAGKIAAHADEFPGVMPGYGPSRRDFTGKVGVVRDLRRILPIRSRTCRSSSAGTPTPPSAAPAFRRRLVRLQPRPARAKQMLEARRRVRQSRTQARRTSRSSSRHPYHGARRDEGICGAGRRPPGGELGSQRPERWISACRKSTGW